MMNYSGSRPPATYSNGKSYDLMFQGVQEAAERDGNKLSPVDLTLSEAREVQLPPLDWTHYRVTPTSMVVRNSGFTLMINANFDQETPYVSSGPLMGNYNFSQIHFHWGEHNETGSAHAVNGVRYPLEMHVVHLKKDCANLGEAFKSKDGIAVMVHLFALQEDRNPQLDQLTAILQFLQKPMSCARLYPTPLAEIVHPFSSDYYMYWGAVGSPKGQYQILWLVSRNVLPVSPQQLDEFRQLQDRHGKLLNSNSNKPFPLAGRTLFIVSPDDTTIEKMYGISRHVNQSLTTSESEDTYDIGNAEYKSLVAFDEVEDCKVCLPSRNFQQNISAGYPYTVNKGDTSIEESCIDLANSSDSSGVTILTEMNTNGKKVITNVNVKRLKHRPLNYSPSEAVYSVVSTKGSELHLRRRPILVRQNDRSTEQACMLLSSSVPLTPSFSAPSLSRGRLDPSQTYVQLSHPQMANLNYEQPVLNKKSNLIDNTGENYNSKFGFRKLPEAVNKSYSVKAKDILDSQSLRQEPQPFSWDKPGTSKQDDDLYFNQFQTGKKNYGDFFREVEDVTENTKHHKYIFVKQKHQNKPACYGSSEPTKEFIIQPNELDQSKIIMPNNKQKYSTNQYIIDDTSINQLNTANQKHIKNQYRDYNQMQYGNNKQMFQESSGIKDYPKNVNVDKVNKGFLINDNVCPRSLPSKEPQTLEKHSHRKQPDKATGKTSFRPQRDSTKTDSHYKVSLLVRTTVSDHTRPGKKRGIAKQYVVTKISPVEKSIIVNPSDINDGVKKAPVKNKGIAENETLYYAKPLLEPELHPELEREKQEKKVRDDPNKNSIGYESPPDSALTKKVKEITYMDPVEGNGQNNEFRDGNVTIRINEKIIPKHDGSEKSPPQKTNQYIINEELQDEVTEFNSIKTRHKVVINSKTVDRQIKETCPNNVLKIPLDSEINKKIDSQSMNQGNQEISKNMDNQSIIGSDDTFKSIESHQLINTNNEKLNDPLEEFHIEEKTQTRILDKDELTNTVVVVKKSRVADPRKIEDRKELNYDIINSKHPEPQFYLKEPQNKFHPVIVMEQKKGLDQQIKGRSKINQTVEYSNTQPIKTDQQKSNNGHDKFLHSNVTKNDEDISEEQTSLVKSTQKKNYLNIQPNDPGTLPSVNDNQSIKKCRTFINLPEFSKENTFVKSDESSPPKRFISKIHEYEPEILIATEEMNEPIKKEEQISPNPYNTEQMVLENHKNQPTKINTTVEYEEIIEENTITSQETKQYLKSTLKGGDKALKFTIQNTNKVNEAPSLNSITVRKIEIPEPHYVTRIPKQPLIEYEAYPVDPHQPFEIMTETLEEMTSIVKTNKTFMMFKKINGKAVLNQPSIIEPMKLETENKLNSQPGTKNNSFARSRTEEQFQPTLPRTNISDNIQTVKNNKNDRDSKAETPYKYNNDPLSTHNNRPENTMNIGENVKGMSVTELGSDRFNQIQVPKKVTEKQITDPSVNASDPENGTVGYNYSETSVLSKVQKTSQKNKYKIQKTSVLQESPPDVDHQRTKIKPENIPIDGDDEKYILEEQNIEETKSTQNSTKVIKSSYKYSQHKLAKQPTSNNLVKNTFQPEHKQESSPQRYYQNPETYTTTEEYYESNTEDYKNETVQRHLVIFGMNPPNRAGTFATPKEHRETLFGQGRLEDIQTLNKNALTGNQPAVDKSNKQFENMQKPTYSRYQSYPSQNIPTDNNNLSRQFQNNNPPQDKTDGDIVIYIRQPNIQDDHISPRITVDVGEPYKMTESELETQKVKVYETKKSTRGTDPSRITILPRKSKSEQYPRRQNNGLDGNLDLESAEEQCIDTTHYNTTLKSETIVELPDEKKSQVKSKTTVIVAPTSNIGSEKKSVPGVKSKVDECCSGVAIEEVAEENDTKDNTSYEEEVVSETSFNQSPIKIQTDSAKIRPLPKINFVNHWNAKGDALLENNGKTLRVTCLEKNHLPYITGGPLNGIYVFYELHFHWGYKDCCGAEHIVDGQRNTIEAHFLYIKKEYEDLKAAVHHTDGIAILAICLNVGNPPNEQLENLIKDMPLLREADTGTYVASEYMFAWIKPSIDSAKGYYSYRGSLTPDPPHVEAVTWMVFPEPIPFCCQQSSEFRKLKSPKGDLLMKNFRPPQPLNNRAVYFVPIAQNM